jgi:hypothetical protein
MVELRKPTVLASFGGVQLNLNDWLQVRYFMFDLLAGDSYFGFSSHAISR